MSDRHLPKRKRIRLPAPAYLEEGSVWHVTVATHRSATPPFLDAALALDVAETIIVRITKWGGLPHLICLMPDHVHLILEVRGKGLTDLVRDFKSVTTRVWSEHGGAGSLWQRSFHDRGLRTPEQAEAAIAYILMNPVKSGFAETWRSIPGLPAKFFATPMTRSGEWRASRRGASRALPPSGAGLSSLECRFSSIPKGVVPDIDVVVVGAGAYGALPYVAR